MYVCIIMYSCLYLLKHISKSEKDDRSESCPEKTAVPLVTLVVASELWRSHMIMKKHVPGSASQGATKMDECNISEYININIYIYTHSMSM